MIQYTKIIFHMSLLLCTAIEVPAMDFTLGAPFSDNMVLQRDQRIPVWGTGSPDTSVVVELAGVTAQARADHSGHWMCLLPAIPASGPHQLIARGPRELICRDVLVGDVWLCSGQSNMEMGLSIVKDGKQEVAQATNKQIRLLMVPNQIAQKPSRNLESEWKVCSPITVQQNGWGGFSAVGYCFGRELQKTQNIPIGLIDATWGGTVCEAWTSIKGLSAEPSLNELLTRRQHFNPQDPNQPANLFNGMIHPLIPLGIKGCIWYQGESNEGRAEQYKTLLPTMIYDWRERWQQGSFPFLIVQLANFRDPPRKPGRSEWAAMREAQAQTGVEVEHSDFVVTIDIGEAHDIHPLNKQDVGHRLGLAARRMVYGEDLVASGPRYQSMEIKGQEMHLSFSDVGGGLVAKGGGTLRHFAIAGRDKRFVWAEARVDGEKVIVRGDSIEQPVAVRYAWSDNPEGCNLYNAEGLPASPFQTDTWWAR